MYEREIAFLAKVEDPADQSNRRKPLDPAAVEAIRQKFPGLPENYLSYLLEVGPGSVRECQYMIYEAPVWCNDEPLFSSVEAPGRKLLVIGDNFSGDLFVLDADHGNNVAEFDHETIEVVPHDAGFTEFIREKMLLGPDGSDLRRRRS